MLDLLVGVAIVVGLLGIVIPVLPGSILIGLAVLVWAIGTGTTTAWWVFAASAALQSPARASLADRPATPAAGVPNRSLVIAGVAGIVGFFVVP